jgi:hypothetical protein
MRQPRHRPPTVQPASRPGPAEKAYLVGVALAVVAYLIAVPAAAVALLGAVLAYLAPFVPPIVLLGALALARR